MKPAGPATAGRPPPAAPLPTRRAAGTPRTPRPRPGWSGRCPARRCYGAPGPTPATGRPCGGPCHTARGIVVRDRPWPPGTAHAARHGPSRPLPRRGYRRGRTTCWVGLAITALTGHSLPTCAWTKQRPFPHRRLCCPSGSSGTTAASDAVPAGRPLPGSSPVIGRHAPMRSRSHRAGDGLPSSRRHLLNVPRPLRRGVPDGCLQDLHRFHGLRPEGRGSALPFPADAGTFTTRQASRDAADRSVAPPTWALDAALRHRAFPPDAGSLLPGPLAATRTGLPPAGDDELQNKSDHVFIGVTPLARWAYSRVS